MLHGKLERGPEEVAPWEVVRMLRPLNVMNKMTKSIDVLLYFSIFAKEMWLLCTRQKQKEKYRFFFLKNNKNNNIKFAEGYQNANKLRASPEWTELTVKAMLERERRCHRPSRFITQAHLQLNPVKNWICLTKQQVQIVIEMRVKLINHIISLYIYISTYTHVWIYKTWGSQQIGL